MSKGKYFSVSNQQRVHNAVKKGGLQNQRGYSANQLTPNMDKRRVEVPFKSHYSNKPLAENIIYHQPVKQGGTGSGSRKEKYLLQGVIK